MAAVLSRQQLGNRIRSLREARGLTQKELAEAIGIGRPSLSQIENGERKLYATELIRLADVINIPIGQLVDPDKAPEMLIESTTTELGETKQIRINVPQERVDKFKHVLLYVLNKVGSKPNIGETVIYKLLYFTDFDYYEKYEKQLIGAAYQKNNYGPTPLGFDKIVVSMIEEGLVTKMRSKYFQFPQTKYIPLVKPDLSLLSAEELELIDDVLKRLSDMNATAISRYSHNDVPWLAAEEGDLIEYESVFYRTAPYSVREYSEDEDI